MNPDRDNINAAYNDVIKKVFANLFDQFITAGGSAAEKAAAEQRYTAGIATARRARDRAIEMLP